MGIGVDFNGFEFAGFLAGQGIKLCDGLDFIAKQRNAPCAIFQVSRENLNSIAAHTKGATGESMIVALILLCHQIGQQSALIQCVTDLHFEGHGGIGFHRANAVNARDRGNDDHIIAFQQRARGGVAHAVNLFVDAGFFLDIGVRARHIGFRLVIIIIGNEIFYRVVWEEFLELAVKLGGECFVWCQNEGRALGFLDNLGHGEGFAGTGDAEQDLGLLLIVNALDQVLDGGGLVAGWFKFGNHFNGNAAFGFLRACRAVGHPFFAVFDQRIAFGD